MRRNPAFYWKEWSKRRARYLPVFSRLWALEAWGVINFDTQVFTIHGFGPTDSQVELRGFVNYDPSCERLAHTHPFPHHPPSPTDMKASRAIPFVEFAVLSLAQVYKADSGQLYVQGIVYRYLKGAVTAEQEISLEVELCEKIKSREPGKPRSFSKRYLI